MNRLRMLFAASSLLSLTRAFARAGAISLFVCALFSGVNAFAESTVINGLTVEYTGATATWVDGELVLTYGDTSAPGTLKLPGKATAHILAVGGGGAGGSAQLASLSGAGRGGGGGGGGVVENASASLAVGEYSITVGKGGAAHGVAEFAPGENGSPSTIMFEGVTVITALGGGGGGSQSAGKDGANGGGGSKSKADGAMNGGTSTMVGGFAGGAGSANNYGGGGGGAGGLGGESGNTSGIGGIGRVSSITGNAVAYGGGGGGGRYTGTASNFLKGSDGGGNGGYSATSPTAGTDGLGGGGGGGGRTSGAAGGSGVVIIRIKEVVDSVVLPPSKPEGAVEENGVWKFEWDGNLKKVFDESAIAYDISGDNKATDVGYYQFTVILKDGFTWKDKSGEDATSDITCYWEITKASNFIENLQIKNWEVGALPNVPKCNYRYGAVKYSYRLKSDEDIEENYSTVPPVVEGEYVLRAVIEETANYSGAVATVDFSVFTGALDTHTDYVAVSVVPNAGAQVPVENLPIRIILQENNPYGFSHEKCFVKGVNTLRVFDAETGDPLVFSNSYWNVAGKSEFWVKIPRIDATGKEILIYWGLRDGKAPVANNEGDTWEKFSFEDASSKQTQFNHSFGLVSSAVEQKSFNKFTVLPTISKHEWFVGEEPATLTKGELLDSGAITNYFINRYTYEVLPEMPVGKGAYAVIFEPLEDDKYYPCQEKIDFMIMEQSPVVDIAGSDGDNGRVLLMNNDKNAACNITYQHYTNTEIGNPTWWQYDTTNDGFDTDSSNFKNLKLGTQFYFRKMTAEGEILWNLVDCRIGNTFRSALWGTGVVSEENYLPWGPTSVRLTAISTAVGTRISEVGNIIMRNTDEAAVYSKCFNDGIGTIYFDAVNQKVGTEDAALKVYIATTCTDDETLPPTDENVELTNGYKYAKWVLAEDVRVYKRVGNNPFVLDERNGKGEIALNMGLNDGSTGGTTNNFYRIVIPVNIEGPVRFKIERTKHNSRIASLDAGDFIILDNIIVSKPPMRAWLTPLGTNDLTKVGKEVLGWAGAFAQAFPSTTDELISRAKLGFYTNDLVAAAEPESFVTSAKMHYRWRYLDQKAYPDFNKEWYSVDLNPYDSYKAAEKLSLPGGVGDIEFYFSGTMQTPFYDYVDYSGIGIKLPYSEEKRTFTAGWREEMTNTYARAEWFTRLREGKSDYEGIRIAYRFAGETSDRFVEMELTKDHTWRGYLETPTNKVGTLSYRLVMYNKQDAAKDEYLTNEEYFIEILTTNAVPVTSSLTPAATPGEYSSVHSDSKTGYLMFQVDDRTKGLTIVHADYQNFNKWNDAASSDKQLFVGRHDEDDKKVGVAPTQREFSENYDTWLDMPTSSPRWDISFPNKNEFTAAAGRPAYESFPEATYNGWDIGPGMWVAQKYRKVGDGAALQMEGRGLGYFQYVLSPNPRGIEKLSFSARLGQDISFENFAYYDAGARERKAMTNYTFYARVAFDGKENKAYTGNASLSMVAHYVPGRGCYEARWEQIDEHNEKTTNRNRGQRLVIYRWAADSSTGKMETKELAAWTNTVAWLQTKFKNNATNTIDKQYFLPMMISVSNTVNSVHVYAGVRLNHDAITPKSNDDKFIESNADTTKRYWSLVYKEDKDSKRLTEGTYGVLSANCEGIFSALAYRDAAIKINSSNKTPLTNKDYKYSNITFNGTVASCREQIEDDYWYFQYGRMQPFHEDIYNPWNFGFKASPVEQKLFVSFRDPSALENSDGSSGWKTVWTNEFDSFGIQGVETEFSTNFYSLADAQIRFEVGGKYDDPRVDIVVDDVKVTQFRGDSWANGGEYVNSGINNVNDLNYTLTNFVYSTSWIKDKSILLSARRTLEHMPSSIRSPLMDGSYGRGEGLGKISFSYTNATENARILLQIATNLNYTQSSAVNLDVHNSQIWHTVSNFNFSTLSPTERKGGTRTVYVGLHGVSGMFRLVVDPELVSSLANEKNPARFGEVEITEILCTDEPMVNERSWWGWNIRSVGQDSKGKDMDWEIWSGKDGCTAEGRMYLSDFSEDIAWQGRSMALNNGYINPAAKILPDGIDRSEEIVYESHYPFIQSPTFTEDIVGEVSFKARKFDSKSGFDVHLQLFGAKRGKTTDAADETWVAIDGAKFTVTNTQFQTYTFKAPPGNTYSAFRLGVPLVDNPQRAVIDEFLVCEAVNANVKLRNIGAFRSKMSENTFVPGVPGIAEQPLCGESWGVQCEVYAAQLPDEIDFTARPPRVFLSWYKGESPWGWENWKTLPDDAINKNRVELMAATGTNLVYRSTNLGKGDTVIPMSTKPGEVVQYMLEVVYYNKESLNTPITNVLDNTMWQVPDWYSPVNYNKKYSSGFAAFNILDTVSPGWAWINEVNVYGGFDNVSDENRDAARQYVEVASPVESSLENWELRFLERADEAIITNTVAVFGDEFNYELKSKKDAAWSVSNMVFHVIASPATKKAKELTAANGTLDGVWKVENDGNVIDVSGEIGTIYPFAVQLVRPSGIIEHEITVAGTNVWAEYQGYAENGDVNFAANKMNELVRAGGVSSRLFGAGYDDNETSPLSLGVFASHGEDASKWNNTMLQTPGRINQWQQISEDHPVPNGEDIFIFSNLDYTMPHIRQTFGELVNSNANTMIVMRKGSLVGTNIVYHVDPWYELAAVATNGVNANFAALPERGKYVVEVGKGASNNVTVVASAMYSRKLLDFGLDPYDRYTPAILDWLEKGGYLEGNPHGLKWENPEGEELHYTKVVNRAGEYVTNLTLKAMYWLDIDPTSPNMYLRADTVGFDPPGVNGDNVRFTAYMCISNDSEKASCKAWPPYVIRGMDIGSHSQGYSKGSGYSWSNATFKVCGMLVNQKTNPDSWSSSSWVPLRWFVFDKDSFYPAGHEKEFQAVIDLINPRSTESPGWTEDWHLYPNDPITFSWIINGELKPIEVEMLNKESTYGN